MRSVEAPSAKEIRPSGEITKHVEEIAVPEFTSREIQLKDIEVAPETPLREIHIESANPEPSHISAPTPPQLRHIEVHPVEVFSPQVTPWTPGSGVHSEGSNDEKGARS